MPAGGDPYPLAALAARMIPVMRPPNASSPRSPMSHNGHTPLSAVACGGGGTEAAALG